MFNSASLLCSQDFSSSFPLYLCLLICIFKGTRYAGVIRSHQLNKWCHFHVINEKTLIPLGQMDQVLSELLQMSPAQAPFLKAEMGLCHLPAFVPLGPDFMDCARWRSRRRGKEWGFSAGLSVPNTSPEVLALAWTWVQRKLHRTQSQAFELLSTILEWFRLEGT